MYRAVKSFTNKDLIDDTKVLIVKRPLFFGKYKWALHFSPDVCGWTLFDAIQRNIQASINGTSHRFVSSNRALYYNLYGNDPQILTKLLPCKEIVEFNSLHIIAPECWHLTQPIPQNKGKFYHKYQFRIKVRDSKELSPETYPGLLEGKWTIARGFFYCQEVRDVIMFKLLHSSDIIDIMERT